MAVVFAVFTYEEYLRLEDDTDEAMQYLGAIEKFTGLTAAKRKLHWVRLETSGQPGFLITIDGGWCNSDRMHFILHDAKDDVEFAKAGVPRQNECMQITFALAPPTAEILEDLNTYSMTRMNKPECQNFVMDWAVDVGKVREWIIENHGESFVLES